ncbi:hypothetical protein LCGC14_0910210 [marine sediment metagenome]|uniref:Uncharacterized protein n=1 Tax=marine sediment metagenome TaxID=412755 RepID=A0A0F9RCR5_9ZZZZ
MLDKIKIKIRSLIGDWSKSDAELFTYTSYSYFTLAELNVSSITEVTKNGVVVSPNDYTWDEDTNRVTITASLTSGDKIIITYVYNKYSNSELIEFIRASLVFISMESKCEKDFELETDEIHPTPSNRDTDLISLVASILINPSYSEYRIPNRVTVKYPRTMTKEKRIQNLIKRYLTSTGEVDVLEWN